MFEKEHSNSSFFNELLKKDKNQNWLSEALKSEYIDINHQDEDGNTFLIKCLIAGKFQSVEWLIKNGADINIKNKQRKTAIHIAIEKNSLPVVKGLLELGIININERDIDGRTLLQNVIVFGNKKMAQLLISHGADINNIDAQGRNILYDALSFGDHSFIEYLLTIETLKRNLIYTDGTTIFEHPEILNNRSLATLLTQYGIDPNIQNDKGETVLFRFIPQGIEYTALIETLLNQGLDPNIKNNENITAYEKLNDIILTHYTENHTSMYKEFLTLFEMIVSNDKKRAHNYLDSNGYPLFFKPLIYNNNKLFELYLMHGFDHKQQDRLGRTIVHTAVWNNNQKVIAKMDLYDKKLKNTPDIYNILPVHYAALLGNQSLCLLFLSMGSNTTSNNPIRPEAIKKFHPMLKNLPKLQKDLEDKILLAQIHALIVQMENEFKIDQF
jgi:ankyrin repeat protein